MWQKYLPYCELRQVETVGKNLLRNNYTKNENKNVQCV